MALLVLRKLILKTRMRSHPVGLDVCFFCQILRLLAYFMCMNIEGSSESGERGGSVVDCRTPEREVWGSRPTSAVLLTGTLSLNTTNQSSESARMRRLA